MVRFLALVVIVAAAALSGGPFGFDVGSHAEAATPAPNVTATLLADVEAVAPGQTFTVGVLLKVKPQWHVYWLNPGDSGKPTEIEFALPDGFTVGALRWPTPVKFTQGGDMVGYGYEGEVLLSAKITAPATLKPGDSLTIKASASWMACDDVSCVEGEAMMTLPLAIAEQAKPAAEAGVFERWEERLPVTLEAAKDLAEPVVATAGGKPGAAVIKWLKPVTEVDWYPAVGPDLLVERVAVTTRDGVSTMTYSVKRFSGDATRVPGVLAFTDEAGRRRSILVDGPIVPGKSDELP